MVKALLLFICLSVYETQVWLLVESVGQCTCIIALSSCAFRIGLIYPQEDIRILHQVQRKTLRMPLGHTRQDSYGKIPAGEAFGTLTLPWDSACPG